MHSFFKDPTLVSFIVVTFVFCLDSGIMRDVVKIDIHEGKIDL